MNTLREEKAKEVVQAVKKPWNKPELIILFRGRPEESVLCHCKHKCHIPVAPGAYHDDCNTNPASCSACQDNRYAS